MRRRRVILIGSVCVALSVLAVAWWPGEREPSYNGKTLFQWLDQYKPYTASLFVSNGLEGSDARDAVRHIGTNGLPCMLRWLRCYDELTWGDRLVNAYAKMPSFLRSRAVSRYLMRHSGRAHAEAGFNGICILGEEARPALPELMRLATTTNAPHTANSAIFLAFIVEGKYRPRVGMEITPLQGSTALAASTNAGSTNVRADAELKEVQKRVVH